MADFYWIAGTGNWSDYTNHWRLGSTGGATPANAPTSADNVFFVDGSAAGVFTVTVDATATCANFDASGITLVARKMTLGGGSSVGLTVNGNWTTPGSTLFAWTTWTSGTVTFAATGTLTTNAVTFGVRAIINGAGATVTLGGAFTGAALTITNGTFDTSAASNYSLTLSGTLTISANTNTKGLNLNASAVTLSASAAITNSSTGNFTFNAGTSTITCSSSSATITGGALTFYNVTYSSTAKVLCNLNGSHTFNNLTFAANAAASSAIIAFTVGATITVNGTLTVYSGAASPNIRLQLVPTLTTAGFLTINAAAVSLTNTDFYLTIAGGAAAPFTGTSLGDCTGNTNITFTAAKTVYWNLLAGGNWTSTAWATGSGVAPVAANYPLPQDTCIIDDAGLTAGNTITMNTLVRVGAITSTRTTAWTYTHAAGSTGSTFFGDLTFDANVTVTTSGGGISFNGVSNVQTFTSAGRTISCSVGVSKSQGGTLRLNGNLTTASTITFTLSGGTLDLTNNNAGNYTLSSGLFVSNNSITRGITFGTGGITTTGSGTVWNMTTVTGFTYTGTSNVTIANNSATATTVTTGALSAAQAMNFTYSVGTYTLTDTASVYKNLIFTGFTGTIPNSVRTIYGDLTFVSGMTLTAGTNTTTFAATSGTQTIISGGKTFDFPVTVNAPGATVQLSTNNLTVGSTRTFTLTAGTFSLNSLTATMGTFSTTGAAVRALGFGTNGTLSLSGTSPFTASGSNFTTSGTGTITLTSGSAKAFAGGGFSYVATLNQGGSGALTISGNNSFGGLANSVQPATISFTAGAITTFTGAVTLAGTAGNLITLNSTIAGTQFKFTFPISPVVSNLSYVNVSDCIGMENSYWRAYQTNGCQNGANNLGGNNLGWIFAPVINSAAAANLF